MVDRKGINKMKRKTSKTTKTTKMLTVLSTTILLLLYAVWLRGCVMCVTVTMSPPSLAPKAKQ
jgi:hypothetical protein